MKNFDDTNVRIDVDLAEAVYVDPEPPPGWSVYICGDVSINADGTLMYALTDGVVAQIWAYDVDADEWSEFGKPFGLIQALEFLPKSDNLLYMHGLALPEDLLLPCSSVLEEDPPPNTLIGAVGQLLGHSRGLQMDVDYELRNHRQYVSVDGEDRCLALGIQDGP